MGADILNIFSDFGILSNHILLFIDWMWFWLKDLAHWIAWRVNISYDYAFISFFFTTALPIVLLIGFIMYVISIFYGDVEWVSKYIGNNRTSTITEQFSKGVAFFAGFLILYMILSNSINKLFIAVSTVQERGIVLDVPYESIETTKKLKQVWTFLNTSLKWPTNTTYESTMKEFVYKRPDVTETNIVFTSRPVVWGSYKIDFDGLTIKEGWYVVNKKSLYLHNIYAVMRDATKSQTLCSTAATKEGDNAETSSSEAGIQLKKYNNLGTSILESYVNAVPEKASEYKTSHAVINRVNLINKVYSRMKDNYIISHSNRSQMINGDKSYGSDFFYKSNLQKIVCGQTIDSINWLDAEKFEKTILEKAYQALLSIERYSEKSYKSINQKQTKEMFTIEAVHAIRWSSYLTEKQDSEVPYSEDYMYVTMYPFMLSFDIGNKIINGSMCYRYIFDTQIDASVKSQWYDYMLDIMSKSCANNFGKVYNYRDNNIASVGKDYFSDVIDKIGWEDTIYVQPSDPDLANYSDVAFILYGSYEPSGDASPKYTKANSFVSDKIGTDGKTIKVYEWEFSDRLNRTPWFFLSLLLGLKDILLSIFIYTLPWIFFVLLLKIIRK